MNLHQPLNAQYPRLPAKKTLCTHLAWLRDLLSIGIPNVAAWVGTSDMYASVLSFDQGKNISNRCVGIDVGQVRLQALFKGVQTFGICTHNLTSTPDLLGTV